VKIEHTTILNAPVAKVWQVVGPEFGNAHVWSSALSHSAPAGSPKHANGVRDARQCDVKGMGRVEERVLEYDPTRHILAYEATRGFPFFVGRAVNRWSLFDQGTNLTLLRMEAEIVTRGIVGALMAPALKFKIRGMLATIADDLKYFVEHGTPHPRKQ